MTVQGSLEEHLLVHVDASGRIDPHGSLMGEGSIDALARAGNTLYMGGEFVSVGGLSRSNLAAMDTTTGTVTAWRPGASSADDFVDVFALAAVGPTVYAGGTFDRIGGRHRVGVAALNAQTGRARTRTRTRTGQSARWS
jgi:hypothetical protein